MTALGWIILVIVVAAALVVLAALFYERASNEVALVRTGMGGRRVVVDGGVLAIPYFHEIARVNMQTIRMEVARGGEGALITRDRLRVDVGAEFHVSVIPDPAAVARAAQTLGQRSFQPDQLKAMVEGPMVDALRAVAAQMTMDELHENRAEFVCRVREALGDVLERYGLQIDSLSLTALDQTPLSALDENNAFTAQGMRRLAEIVARARKERAEIESEAQVAVRRAEMEAKRRRLEIELDERRAEIQQTQEIEMMLAAQLAEVAGRRAEAERAAAQARIRMEQEIQTANIARALAIREAEIAQARALEIAEQERQIQLAAKSQEGARAEAEAKAARAAVIEAEERLESLRQTAEAERRRKLALMAAEQEAEAQAVRARIGADADRVTARVRAEIRREEAETLRLLKEAEAAGEAARIAAENGRSEASVRLELERARLAALPAIVAEMVRPAEKIRGISINHVTGLGRGPSDGAPQSPVDQTIAAILDMAVSLPAMRKIGEAVGVNLEGILPEQPGPSAKGG
ncbi:MAG: flotillin family protein [Paracoccaceae bacterium]|nr:MAG: flotillin family protein [Paracoccaceae bacterium]